jgi:NTP pyrophosphatase (non-canonical NTP hydrolase)
MTFDEYEAAAARTINVRLSEPQRLFDAAAGLAEEAGEILGVVRKHLYQSRPIDRDALALELGDALWCLAIVAKSSGFSLADVASRNVAKLRARYPDGLGDVWPAEQ